MSKRQEIYKLMRNMNIDPTTFSEDDLKMFEQGQVAISDSDSEGMRDSVSIGDIDHMPNKYSTNPTTNEAINIKNKYTSIISITQSAMNNLINISFFEVSRKLCPRTQQLNTLSRFKFYYLLSQMNGEVAVLGNVETYHLRQLNCYGSISLEYFSIQTVGYLAIYQIFKIYGFGTIINEESSFCWAFGLCFSSFCGVSSTYEGQKETCDWGYDGRMKCKLDGKTEYTVKASEIDCTNDQQCYSIKAAFPITIILILGIFVSVVMTFIKHSIFPRNFSQFNSVSITITTICSISLLSVGIALLFSLIGQDNINLKIWVLVSQILISFILLISIKFVRDEENLSRIMKEKGLDLEINILKG